MVNPSRASVTAGSTSRCQLSDPCSDQARCNPATVPDTPTARWLLWCRTRSYSPFVMNIVGKDRPGAVSRKS